MNFRLFWDIVRRCRFDQFIIGFVISFFAAAFVLWIVEPGIHTYWDGIWFTFVSCTSIGYGDLAAVSFIGRLVTMFITLYEILLVALLSGVIVSHYLEVIHRQEEYTATVLMDKLKHLTELSPEELAKIQERACELDRRINVTGKKR